MQHLLAPPKLEPRLMKNRMISSRSGQPPSQPQIPPPVKQNPVIRQQVSIRMTGSEHAHTPHKRLKLKDYLHLNDLEKRSRANRSLSSKGHIEPSRQTDQKVTVGSRRSVTSALGQEGDHEIALKKEILKKIEEERSKLADMQNYIRNDFQRREGKSETYLFLFNLYNGLTEAAKISAGIGKEIVEYEDNKPLASTHESNKNYYWDRNSRNAFSPAKILPTALQMTFNVAQILGLGNS